MNAFIFNYYYVRLPIAEYVGSKVITVSQVQEQ